MKYLNPVMFILITTLVSGCYFYSEGSSSVDNLPTSHDGLNIYHDELNLTEAMDRNCEFGSRTHIVRVKEPDKEGAQTLFGSISCLDEELMDELKELAAQLDEPTESKNVEQ